MKQYKPLEYEVIANGEITYNFGGFIPPIAFIPPTPSVSASPTPTPSITPTQTTTPTPSITSTQTSTPTPTPTETPTQTPTPSITPTQTPSETPTQTPTETPTPTPTPSTLPEINWVVAQGNDKGAYVSNNSTAWYLPYNIPTTSGVEAEWGGDKWILVGNTSPKINYSYDGKTWLPSSNGDTIFTGTTYPQCAVYNGSRWVAAGFGVNPFAVSDDGITWTASTNGGSLGLLTTGSGVAGIDWDGTKFAAACNAGNTNATICLSYDGFVWSASTNAYSAFSGTSGTISGRAIKYAGGKWVAGIQSNTQTSSTRVAYSNDGFNWTKGSGTGLLFINSRDFAYGNGTWVYVGTASSGAFRGFYSSDGISWIGTASIGSVLGVNVFSVDYDAQSGYFLALGGNIPRLAISTDGITWTGNTSLNSVVGSFRQLGFKYITPTPTPSITPTNTITPTPSATYTSWNINECGGICSGGVCDCYSPTPIVVYTSPSVANLPSAPYIYTNTSLTTIWEGFWKQGGIVYESTLGGVATHCTAGDPC
jgi:hypothetical protein